MKKNSIFFRAVRLIFGFVILLNSTTLFSKESRPVEVLMSSDSMIYEQGLYGIQSVVKMELKINYLDILKSENPDLSVYFRELEASGIPMFIAIGAPAAKLAREYLKKTPLVFSMVNSPKFLGLESGDICGVSMDISVSEFFQTLKDILPDSKGVYSFYSTTDGEFVASEGEYTDLKYNLYFHKKRLSSSDDFRSALEEIKGKADAFYMVNDPLYNKENFEKLSEFCRKNKIILMTSFPALVKIGATFGISPDYSKIGVITGQLGERIYSKESTCSKERVKLPDQSSFFLNEEYAKKSGIKVPEAIVDRAKFTGLFVAGVNKLNEGKLKSAKIIFDEILKRDPKNVAASAYRELVIEKMTGTETKKYMLLANEHFQAGRFSQARAEYQKILNINPNLVSAKEGYQKSVLGQSEQERTSGNNALRAGKVFEAIKLFLASLRTLPSNTKASSDLSQTRSREIFKVPDYIKDGIKNYNNRDYENSITIFEDVLLVDPGNKEATEYLRLSYKKQEAIKVLIDKTKK
ncbi:MAG: peptide ABC transporter substrate-binding protein [Leptospiraceae bacterium]|nr:peptide ABC transporter substrate-binding protein [Leptospiraceae bacterium]MCK6380075.1 peptide ABC transporter substrate-binding protein [Leptospiraceae bacterium]NUM40484.1 peptide ABC transporter substrate-binding protein [Leptospiraceae bacterium]